MRADVYSALSPLLTSGLHLRLTPPIPLLRGVPLTVPFADPLALTGDLLFLLRGDYVKIMDIQSGQIPPSIAHHTE